MDTLGAHFALFSFMLCIMLTFFFQCAEEAHRPVDCDTVNKWILKNSAESENMNWYELNISYWCYFRYT